jgi:flagellar biosynthesis protein FliR
VEVTPATSVASDGSSNPSFQLLVGGKVGVVARAAVATFVVWVSSSSYSRGWGAQWWCRGRLQWENRGAAPHILYLLLERETGALLLLLLSSTFLLLVQVVVQSLQVARLTGHWTAKRTLHEMRG